MHFLYFGALLFGWLHLTAGEDAINADIVNSRVQRTVDLTTHLPKISSRITVENAGKTVVRYYVVAIDPNLTNNVSFVGASVRTTEYTHVNRADAIGEPLSPPPFKRAFDMLTLIVKTNFDDSLSEFNYRFD